MERVSDAGSKAKSRSLKIPPGAPILKYGLLTTTDVVININHESNVCMDLILNETRCLFCKR